MEQGEKRYSILDELAKCAGYDIALMTTFNFEVGFFERAVLNRLYAKDVKTVSLFVDAREFTAALNEFNALNNGSHMGRKYMVTPVKMDGAFHPKVILMLGEKKARLFVGSANVKTSGFATNNEVFNFIDYDADHPEYLDVIVDAINFFDEINEISYKLDNAVIKAAKEYIYYHKAERNNKAFLLHNMKQSIIEQVRNIVSEDVEDIQIAVPYYDKELKALQQIKDAYPGADIKLYIQNKSSTFPVDYNKKHNIADTIKVFSGFKDNSTSSSGNFYHGKLFLIRTKEQSYVLYGSTNCTLSALAKTHADGGNVECDFFEVGGKTDFDYFFDNMELTTKETLLSKEMVFEEQDSSLFVYKYGVVRDNIELHVEMLKNIDGLVVWLGEKELEYRLSDGELVISIGEEYRDILTDIFDLTMIYGEQKEHLRCWTYNPDLLAVNREVQARKDDLIDFDIDATGDKYIEDRMKFMKAEATCLNEWQEYKNNLKYMNQIQIEQESESDEPEDFIIDYKIPDEYRYAYRQYNEAAKIRSIFVRRFLGVSFISGSDVEKANGKGEDPKSNETSQKQTTRKATSDEVRFERFIKGKVKGMMNDVYVEAIELEHYIGLVQVVMEIFEKYHDIEDIFQPDYVIQTTSSFIKKIIEKPLDDSVDSDKIQAAIIKKSFRNIIAIFLYYRNLPESDDRWKYEALNKGVLFSLEKKYGLRQSYRPYVKQVFDEDSKSITVLGYEGACNYIEQLYGYKTLDMLRDSICAIYSGAELSMQGTSIRISVETEHILECRRVDTSILKEIANYGRMVAKVTVVYIEFLNIAPNPENKNVIEKIKHSISMDYHKWKYSEIRQNGDASDSKSQYLPF